MVEVLVVAGAFGRAIRGGEQSNSVSVVEGIVALANEGTVAR